MRRIELYRFARNEDIWTYTSSPEAVTYNSEVYLPVPIGRNNIELKDELAKANLEIQMDTDNPMAVTLLNYIFDGIVTFTLFLQEDAAFSTLWKGRLANIKPSNSKFILNFESIATSMRRPGLRARYQRNCRHALYHRGCSLDLEDFAVNALAVSVDHNILEVPDAALEPDGYYLGGMVRAPDGTLRMIIAHTGAYLKLTRQFNNVLIGVGYGYNYGNLYGGEPVEIILYPGCDRTKSTCISKFNNLENFGGFPYIPKKNPFGGTSIA